MKLLIIDDEEDLLECIVESVSSLFPDLVVIPSSRVEDAKNKISGVDIVISDINMPLRKDLEAMLSTCGKPVARITGHDNLKGDLVIYKPYSNEDLSRVINILIKMHKKMKL